MGNIGPEEPVFFSRLLQLRLGPAAQASATLMPPPSSSRPQKFLAAGPSGGLQSIAAPVGGGESREGSEKETARRQAGHTERGPGRGQATSEPWPCPWGQARSLRICLALGQSAARQPRGF